MRPPARRRTAAAHIGLAAAFMLTLMAGGVAAASTPAPKLAADHMRIAIPLYVYPGTSWTRVIAARTGFIVMNPDSGPGGGPDPAYVAAVRQAQAGGVRVLGYVPTGYGKTAVPHVRSQIADYYAWYEVDGIFLDETPYACDPRLVTYYTELRETIIRYGHRSRATIVMNPGTVPAADCYMSIANVLVTFEDNARVYTARRGNHYTAAAWLSRYPPDRVWHIVYGVPDAAAMRRVASLAAERGAGWLFATDLGLPNPYGALPSYFAAETAAAGKTRLRPPRAR